MPQEPTRWLEPKLLVLIGVQVALSTKFAEFFDRRDAHATFLSTHPEGTTPAAGPGRRSAEPTGGPVEPTEPYRGSTSPVPMNCGWTTSPTPATGSTPPRRSPRWRRATP